MPRKPKSSPIAAAIEAAETAQVSAAPVQEPVPAGTADQIEAAIAAIAPLTPEQLTQPPAEPFRPGDSYEGDLPATATDFTPPRDSFVRMTAKAEPAKVFGVSLDERQGVKIEVERDRQPGQVGPRVLIKFRNDMPPGDEEKALLRAEGFAYSAPDRAWCAPKSAANLVVAKRAVNAITKERGDEGAQLFV